ncbi:ATP-binding protein [Amycolatopsis sp. NPDC051371]|uniref:ATP-binding protein n=1 Tax=Amycolatopsis sp. NPDC051371 TaxID=3155800 RepID=UPI003437F2C6
MTGGDGLQLAPQHGEHASVVTVTGVLDLGTYPLLRDGLLKIAADTSDLLVADINGLRVTDSALLTVFSLVAMRAGDWPGIPFAVVVDRPDTKAMLAERTVDRFVPVQADLAAAEAVSARPARRRATRLLVRSPHVSALARAFVERTCAAWSVSELADDAQMVVTELVENTMQHTRSDAHLRLELRPGFLTVAVHDDDPGSAVLLERLDLLDSGLGLHMVAQLTKVWGCSRSWSGGKTVWAVLNREPAPDGGRGKR